MNTTEDHALDGCAEQPGDCTLREAVVQDTATEIQLPHDTYPLASQLSISRPLTIRGTDDDELATLTRANAETPMRIIAVEPGIPVQIFRLRSRRRDQTRRAAGSSSRTLRASSSPTARSWTTWRPRGGGIWAAGTLTLVRTTVASNDAVGDGEGQLGRGGGVGLPTVPPATWSNTT